MSFLNPSFQRKQLIRSSINLRRSTSYSNPNLPNIASGSPNHYTGSHIITLGPNQGAESRPSLHNEKFANELTSALLPANQPYLPEGYCDHDPHRILPSHQPENPTTSNTNTLPQLQPLAQYNHSNLRFQDPNLYSQSHEQNNNQPEQQSHSNYHVSRVEPPSNANQTNLQHYPAPSDSPQTNFLAMPVIDRALLSQAYRQEELRSVTTTESVTPSSPAPSKPAELTKKAKALYTCEHQEMGVRTCIVLLSPN